MKTRIKEIISQAENKEFFVCFLNTNRTVEPKDLKPVVDSIKSCGYADSFPISVISLKKAKELKLEFKYFDGIEKDDKGNNVLLFHKTKPEDATDNNTLVVIDGQHRFLSAVLAGETPSFYNIDSCEDINGFMAILSNTVKPWNKESHLTSLKNRVKDSILNPIFEATESTAELNAAIEFCTMSSSKSLSLSKLKECSKLPSKEIENFLAQFSLTEDNITKGLEIFNLIKNHKEKKIAKLSSSSRVSRVVKSDFNTIRSGDNDESVYNLYKWLFSGDDDTDSFVKEVINAKSMSGQEFIGIVKKHKNEFKDTQTSATQTVPTIN